MSTKSKATRRPKENRKPLASLQVHRSDASILVGGRSRGKSKKKISKEFNKDRIPTQVETFEKGTQTVADRTESIDYQLCCSDPPPSLYWEVMAEKRRVALKDTLQENKRLLTEIEALRAQVKEGERQHNNNALYFQLMYRTVTEETKNL